MQFLYMEPSVTTFIYLDKRRQKKDETYPLKLRVTYQRVQKYYGLNLSLSIEDYEKTLSPKPRGIHKENSIMFAEIERRAQEIITGIESFSFEEFRKRWNTKPRNRKLVFEAIQAYIDSLITQNRIRTAESHRCTLASLKKYSQRKRLPFTEITAEFLHNYERWMLGQNNSISTVGIYLRNLRTVYNKAINDGDIDAQAYPFGKGKYQIPSSRNIKKALSREELKKIFEYKPEPLSPEDKYRDLWLFSYLCNGMNVKDIAHLRYENIDGNNLHFVREKTKRTTRSEQKVIAAPLLPYAQGLIEKWGQKPRDAHQYIFDILEPQLSPEKALAKIKQEAKQINKYMRRIGEKVGITTDITTYTARHTFSTQLKRSGASLELISESLGHKDLKTTERYLDSFEDQVKRTYAEKLLDFGNDA